jgi:putative transcriptional regulator
MPIIVRLDVMIARRKISSKELAARIGITEANLSLLKRGHVKGVRFETLAKLCRELDCQPGDLLEYEEDDSRWNAWSIIWRGSGTARTV